MKYVFLNNLIKLNLIKLNLDIVFRLNNNFTVLIYCLTLALAEGT